MQIIRMHDNARMHREKHLRLLHKSESSNIRETQQSMLEADSENQKKLKNIVEKEGWPSPELVGKDGVSAAFSIVQHSDLSLQKYFFPFIEKAYKSGHIHGESLALLTDRILVGEGKEQLYGTQARLVGKKIVFYPIEDKNNLDMRRKSLGLIPMDEYIIVLEKVYLPKSQISE